MECTKCGVARLERSVSGGIAVAPTFMIGWENNFAAMGMYDGHVSSLQAALVAIVYH
jgi:hypothetical protein